MRTINDTIVLRGIMTRARRRLESGFCRDAYARDEIGHRVPATSPSAVCWCMIGAIKAELDPYVNRYDLFREARRYLPLTNTWGEAWSDEHTQEEVLAAMDNAIQRLRMESEDG